MTNDRASARSCSICGRGPVVTTDGAWALCAADAARYSEVMCRHCGATRLMRREHATDACSECDARARVAALPAEVSRRLEQGVREHGWARAIFELRSADPSVGIATANAMIAVVQQRLGVPADPTPVAKQEGSGAGSGSGDEG